METVLIVAGGLFVLLGLIGSVAPVLPGPPLGYVGLLALQFLEDAPFSTRFLVIMGLIVAFVTAVDYWIPIYGAKRFGGGKYGVWGSAIGLAVGIFIIPPFGIVVGPFLGAVAGELISGKEFQFALKAGFGSFLGFLAGTALKLALSVVIAYYFVDAVF